jgi:diguanylate cyclase (GGDEF)-like protein
MMTRPSAVLTTPHTLISAWKSWVWLSLCLHLALGLMAALGVSAAVAATEYPKTIHFRNIMQDKDIALGEVEAILQDHEGFMWLGGRNALLRYDGYDLLGISYAPDPQNPEQTQPLTHVLELLEDSRHHLWAATRSGLYRYDRDRELMLPVLNDRGVRVSGESINALAESIDGKLLIGSELGFAVFDSRTLIFNLLAHRPGDPESLPSNFVNEIYVEPQGVVWLGLREGMLRIAWAGREMRLFVPDPANPASTANNSIRTIAADHQGNIWGGSDNGLYRLEPVTGAIHTYRHDPADPYSLSNSLTWQIFVDNQGWIWTGSDGGGVNIYDENHDRFLRFLHKPNLNGSVSSNSIRRIYEDDIGDIWIGTYPSGVNVYDRSTSAIRVFRAQADLSQGLLGANVEAVEEDAEGNLWIGANGVTRYNPKDDSLKHYQNTAGSDSRIGSTSILNGVVDSDGELRFGSWAHGILIYNPQQDRFDELPADTTLTSRGEKTGTQLNDLMVWSVYEDRRKDLWISTHYHGLTRFDKQTGIYTYYPHDINDSTTISSTVVWTTLEDSQGRFWVGTANGLNLMDRDRGTFKHYFPQRDNPRSLANPSVLSIYEDRRGRVWFGTDAGLHLYHPESDDFTVYNTNNGFVDQGIRAIIEDPSGNLWLGTNNGVIMFNPDTGLVRNYTSFNGEQIGGVATGAAIATRKGEMAFGTRTGLYLFNANALLINEKSPPVVLTDFRIFTRPVPIGGPDTILTKAINQTEQITLDHTKIMISFGFAALNFRDSVKNQYAYKLEGFDDKWREVGTLRSALYTNLPSGTYDFRVRGSNNDGIWNSEGRSVRLIVLPPPWKTWWAYCIYIGTALGLLFYFVYTQHKKVLDERKTSRSLEIKVADRTAELQNKNAELERAYEQLEAISLSDPLTGLSNRRYLQKLMPADVAKVQREYDKKFPHQSPRASSLDLSFFLLDVDHFKSVNDIHGHAAGDNLLVQLAELLIKICRQSDCVVRWGGEEFLIVSRFADRDEAPLMAERIRKTMERHHFILPDGGQITRTCSIGFACLPFLREHPMALSWEEVINIADHALYAAKKSGRNRSVGLASNTATRPDVLHQGIAGGVKVLIENQELTVIGENANDLVWD